MKTWHRSEIEFTCGYCGRVLPAGTPCFTVTLHSVKRQRLRCAECAWEPQPTVLHSGRPEHVVTPTHVDADGIERPGPAPMSPLRDAMAALDHKAKASGE